MTFSPEQVADCLEVLQYISDNPTALESVLGNTVASPQISDNETQHLDDPVFHERDRIKSLIAKIYKQGRKGIRRNNQQQHRHMDRALKQSTALVQAHQEKQQLLQEEQAVPTIVSNINATSPVPQAIPLHQHLQQPNRCYVCKQLYTQLHFFYHRLCPDCADLNYQKRQQRTDLSGRVALVTGGRIKIGYQVALKLLRDGANVIVTTRFPYDCAQRYSMEADVEDWQDRLKIYRLDFRNILAVEAFANTLLDAESALDIIINNAAQTIQRSPQFYQTLTAREEGLSQSLPALVQARIQNTVCSSNANPLGGLPSTPQAMPLNQNGVMDQYGQPMDYRPHNSWVLKLDQVSTSELLEVQVINVTAPFILNSQLKPLMMRSPFPRRFIVNVSAMEGQFSRDRKTIHHPHTNMAKAALNMMTRTSSADYAQAGIYMNSVDPGWISNESPYPIKQRMVTEQQFYAPLDAIDSMARIYDPIVQGINLSHTPIYGCLLKDYSPHPW